MKLSRLIFEQERVGRKEKLFRMYKLRTMEPPTADSPNGQVTSFGRFLRTWRLDEVPQIINVLKGEMSFFGPRPLLPEVYEKLPIDIRQQRSHLKPGWLSPAHTILGTLEFSDIVAAERRYFCDIEEYGATRVHTKLFIAIAVNVVLRRARGRTP